MTDEQKQFLQQKALGYFLKYVRINSQSDPDSGSLPSSKGQMELGDVVADDLQALGCKDAFRDLHGYVYATLNASEGSSAEPLSFIAHLDTSPSEPGIVVKPIIHKAYDGGNILFPDEPELILTPAESPELLKFIGEDIITAAGKTLLGADDKAGVAAIMAAIALFRQDSSLRHPEIRICFTPDEETGRGVDEIDLTRLGKVAYTIDGGEMGELEAECFDAWSAAICFKGRNVHPGSAKNVMVNAAAIAARFIADLPEWQTPERTEKLEGFYHLTDLSGDENEARAKLIIRDFDVEENLKRIAFLDSLSKTYQARYPGLVIEQEFHHSYQNMFHILKDHAEVIDKAAQAIEQAGVRVLRNAIRGGTDGARLCYMGLPTPNIFGGGLMFHSRREWIPVIALQKAAEVIVNLAGLYY